MGKNHQGALVTLAERKSRYVLARHLRSKHSAGVTIAVTRLLRPHKNKCHTVTFDNGLEFAGHDTMRTPIILGSED
jgi:transposase, IS30 family